MSRSTNRGRIALTLGAVGCCAGAPAAQAQPRLVPALRPDVAAPPPPPASYRRQILIADGAAAAAIAGGVAAGRWLFASEDFHLPLGVASLGFTSYVVAGPTIHVAHGHLGRGLASAAVRVFAPAILSAAATSVRGLDEDAPGYTDTFFAGLVGGVACAMVLDAWLLVPDGDGRGDAPGHASRRLEPAAAVAPGGAVVGLAGSW